MPWTNSSPPNTPDKIVGLFSTDILVMIIVHFVFICGTKAVIAFVLVLNGVLDNDSYIADFKIQFETSNKVTVPDDDTLFKISKAIV